MLAFRVFADVFIEDVVAPLIFLDFSFHFDR